MQSVIEHIREGRLIAAAKRGDRAAFDSLCRQHRSGIFAFICSRAPSDRAEDLLQDVWMTGWERLSTFAGRSSYRSWILGIAVNKIREFRRKPVEYTNVEYGPETQIVSGQKSESDDAILRIVVREAVAKLPEPQREVIDLYYFGGLTLPEVAVTLNRNLNTVKYQFYAAHDRVAALLSPVTTPGGPRQESREAV